MGVFFISFTNTYNSILLCTEYTYAYTTAADIVLYTWKPKYLHIIFTYYIHVKNEGRSLLGFSPLSHFFLARTIECAEQEHIFVNFDEKGFFHQK